MLEEIAAQDYILTPGRYVGVSEADEEEGSFEEEMETITDDLSAMFAESARLEKEIRQRLGEIGWQV